ncbi:MAG: hypothetical protein PWP67_1589 [Clostridium butyricum]|nr:hypothetical protein [Clostridium butyricum]
MKKLDRIVNTVNYKNFDINLWATLASRVLSAIGYTMIMPFLAIMLARYHNLNTNQVAIVVSIYGFSQTGLMIPASFIVDRIGYKLSMIIGRILGGVIYILYLYISNVQLLALISITIGLGTSMFNLACKSFVSLNIASDEQKKLQAFTLYNLSLNIGGALGTLIGAIFMDKNGIVVLIYVVSVLNILAAIIIDRIVVLDFDNRIKNKIKDSLLGFVTVIKNKKFCLYFVVIILIHISYSQFFTVLPIYFSRYNVSMLVYSIMLVINTIISVLFQIPLMIIINKKIKSNSLLGLGLGSLLIGFSIAILFLSTNMFISFFVAIVFTLGELIFTPFEDKAISDTINNVQYTSAYFSIASLGWSLAKGLGNYVGIKMLSVLHKNLFSIFISSFSLIASILLFFIYFFKQDKIIETFSENNL